MIPTSENPDLALANSREINYCSPTFTIKIAFPTLINIHLQSDIIAGPHPACTCMYCKYS